MLIETDQLLIFLAAGLVLNLTPGNDMLFCFGQGLKSGPKAGIAASFGIATGSLVYALLAAFGLAALVAAHPLAFEAIRWVGVAYLLWLAVQAFRQPASELAAPMPGRKPVLTAWRSGILVNLLNPKFAVFLLAFLPQFVDPAKGATVVQFLLLSTLLNIQGTAVNALVGGFAGRIGGILSKSKGFARALQAVTGVVFLSLALRLAVERR